MNEGYVFVNVACVHTDVVLLNDVLDIQAGPLEDRKRFCLLA